MPGRLVSEDERLPYDEVADASVPVVMHIRAAGPDRLDADQDLSRAGFGDGALREAQLPGSVQDGGAHGGGNPGCGGHDGLTAPSGGVAVWRGRRAIRLWTGELPRRPLVWIFALLHLATAVAIRFLEPDPEFTAPAPAPAVDDRGVPAGRH
ncbi:hypothetical protein OHU45_36795 [Streptomyces tubercidicus]|uniref:hypothetical protein n=1 Tax=Streptomyces tubercidicus TaxID=47759 RepID=UPI0030DF225F|nr:hypothetical protein OG690_00590 [Streptomyces tubercidicus]